MGGTGSAPNPLAYCFWGGMACYALIEVLGAQPCHLVLRIGSYVTGCTTLSV